MNMLIRSKRQLSKRMTFPATVALCVLSASPPLNAGTAATQLLARPEMSSPAAASSDNAFGAEIDPRTGSTQFRVADVSVQTTSGLPMSVGRKLVVSQQRLESPALGMYDNWGGVRNGAEPAKEVFGEHWELDVPYMHATFDARTGWVSASSPGSNSHTTSRCSAGFQPPTVQGEYPYFRSVFKAKDYWSGITINIPGIGSEALLSIAAEAPRPQDGVSYRGSTTSGWRISCLPSIKNGHPGEGFVALLPDGTKYYFDWLATKRKPSLMSGGGISFADGDTAGDVTYPEVMVPFVNAYLFATKVEDRFGNWVAYDYDPIHPQRLQSIRSSDGALIQVNHGSGGQVTTITTGERTWTYNYAPGTHIPTGQLVGVTQPDGSDWNYTDALTLGRLFYENESDIFQLQKYCIINVGNMSSSKSPDADDIASFTIKAPSGALGTFKFREIVHGTNRTPGSCNKEQITVGGYPNQPGYVWVTVLKDSPLLNRIASIYEKQISGPGLQTLTWTYYYTPSWSYLSQCPDPSSCLSTSRTDVTGPDGTITRYTHGNDYLSNAGQPLQVVIEKNGIARRTEVKGYLQSAAGQAFIDAFGTDPHPMNNPLHSKNRPLATSSITQDGRVFASRVDAYDQFVRPTTIVRWSQTAP